MKSASALASPAGMVRLKPGTAGKSSTTVAVWPVTETTTRVSSLRAPGFSIAVTVTVCSPPFSVTLVGFRVNAMPVEAVSSSPRVSVAEVTGNAEVPLT